MTFNSLSISIERVKLFLLSFLILNFSLAEEEVNSREQRKKNRSTFLIFGIMVHQVQPDFLGSSDNSTYENFENQGAVQQRGVQLRLAKEFFPNSRFSMTTSLGYATLSGSDKPERDTPTAPPSGGGNGNGGNGESQSLMTNNQEFEKRVKTQFYSMGIDLNVNFKSHGLKVQPYLGANYIQANSEHRLTYQQETDEIRLHRSMTYSHIIPELGIRFIDFEKSMMSFISLAFPSEESFESENQDQATLNDNTINVSYDTTGRWKSPMISIGFGWVF